MVEHNSDKISVVGSIPIEIFYTLTIFYVFIMNNYSQFSSTLIFNWLLKNGCKLKAEAETTESKYLEYGDTKIRISRHFPNSMSANSIYVMIPVNNKHSFGLFIGKQYCAISDIRELKTVLKALFVVLDIKAFGELSKISLEEQRVKFNIDTISLKEKEIERKKEEIKLLKEQIEVLKEKVKNQASTLTILQKKK